MKKINTLLGVISLPLALVSFVCAGIALFEPTIDWYKVGFWFLLINANFRTFMDYLVSND